MEKTTKTDQILERKSDNTASTSLLKTDEKSAEEAPKSFETTLSEALGTKDGALVHRLLKGTSDEADVRSIATNSLMMNTLMKTLKGDVLHECLNTLYIYVTDIGVLASCIKARFGVNLGAKTPEGQRLIRALSRPEKSWTLVGAKRVYKCLLLLPPSHVAQVKDITTTNTTRGTSGAAVANLGVINIDYIDSDPDRIVGTTYCDDPKDAQFNLPLLDTTIVHEIGHVVDAGKSPRYSEDPGFRKISGWKDEGQDAVKLAKAIEGCATTPYANVSIVEEPIAKKGAELMLKDEVVRESDIEDRVKKAFKELKMDEAGSPNRGLPTYNIGCRSAQDLTKVLEKSTVYQHIIRSWASKSPWKKGLQADMKRQIHQGYKNSSWYSFDNAAFVDKISQYQLRDPGEEFAEVYATYHVANPKGDKLKAAHKDGLKKMGLDTDPSSAGKKGS
ncbi:MAG: hypothetical protein FWC40_00550 [Proteobacteria bacterium]|nr:hypothetical protein [Pseudomonadota bacterium]